MFSLPLYLSPISAGFPSPAEDYIDNSIDLNRFLISNRPATYFFRMKGNAMQGAGIFDNDLLVVDASLRPELDDITLVTLEGDWHVRRLVKVHHNRYALVAENTLYEEITLVNEDNSISFFGVVTSVIRRLK